MPPTEKDWDALEEALKNNNIEDAKKLLQTFDVTAANKYDANILMYGCGYSSSTDVVKLMFHKIVEVGGTILCKGELAANDKFGWTCLMYGCGNSSSPEVMKLIFQKIVEIAGTDVLKGQVAATDRNGRTGLMLACSYSSSAEVVKLILQKIIEVRGTELLTRQLAATDSRGSTCLMLCCSNSSSPEVMKLLAASLFHFGLFQDQYAKLNDDHKKGLKEKANIEVSSWSSWNPFGSSWTPDAATLAEVNAILYGGNVTKKNATSKTQEDFDALEKALEKNNIEDLKKIISTFDVTATNSARYKKGWTCLMHACSSPRSPEIPKLVCEKIMEVGGISLLRRQLAATDSDGLTAFMRACIDFSSPKVIELMLEKIVEAGGTELLKSQFTPTSAKDGMTCFMRSCGLSYSNEVVKLLAVVLFCLDLFKQEYARLDKNSVDYDGKVDLREKAGIDSASWTPDAASIAEVKEILEGDGVAKKKAEEEAALSKENAAAKKKAEEEAAAAKNKTDTTPTKGDDRPPDGSVSIDSPPPSLCFKRGVPSKSLDDSINSLLSIKEAPPKRPDLDDWIPDKSDRESLLHYLNTALGGLKSRPAIQKLITENGLTDDDIKILHSYKIQTPYPVYLWLNGWLGGDRRDDFVKENVAPFFTLLYRAMEKLPRVTVNGNRGIRVNNIPALKNTYDNHKTVCVKGAVLSFWGFSSFSTADDVVNREEFVGKPDEEGIVYSCGDLVGVDLEPFKPKGLNDENEVLPLCPSVFKVVSTFKMGKKLIVAVEQMDHSKFAYVVANQ